MVELHEIRRVIAKHAGGKGRLIPVLQAIQREFGYVPPESIGIVAEELRVPASTVYGVATFYAQFRLTPPGKHVIRVCQGTACHVRGGQSILRTVSELLGIGPGGTTSDGLFTLEQVACLGACGLSPVLMVDDVAYGRLTPERIPEILAGYRSGVEEAG